ncbi:MAG: DEAD/DEAH box helicase [Planctomycetota bacterium]|nr:DEAD/DEAH box helicase [Planctomycetota bacterium]
MNTLIQNAPNREELAFAFLATIPFTPYPVQEEAILGWYSTDQGILVCAPTGTGKTLIAECAVYEALRLGKTLYYTTPLIALTDQKLEELRATVARWGYGPESVGLVTGNRSINPRAPILVVVAEILLNRLLHPAAFPMTEVHGVVMDEFHNFADQERGIVWELSLALLPLSVRLMLLSATVGNANEFLHWLSRCHNRKLDLIESRDRKVPLSFHYVADEFLQDHMEWMAKGEGEQRKTPALVFCFQRDGCWSTGEILKGQDVMAAGTRDPLLTELAKHDWTKGAGPKLIQMLRRGVGVHHAGVLPRYRKIIEDLFQRKLLSVVVCTETLAAGINLPARSVILTSLVKGPMGKHKLMDASSAQQIFGRAGRPQFDDKGFVFGMAHEDDVRMIRWKRKMEGIPEDTKDPGLLRQRKMLKKKKPDRNDKQLYWTENQFQQLQQAAPTRLYSKGPLPWRLLAYLLEISPEVGKIRTVIRKRLLDTPRIAAQEIDLNRRLLVLHEQGFVKLTPEPPLRGPDEPFPKEPPPADMALPTEKLKAMLHFRSIHPLYGVFLLDFLPKASEAELLQILESLLELSPTLGKSVRVPWGDRMPPGPLATEIIDPELVQRGLIRSMAPEGEGDEEADVPFDPEQRPPHFAEKVAMLFEARHEGVPDLQIRAVWAAGELLLGYGGNFNMYVRNNDLVRQEGMIFRHLLRMILLCEEFDAAAETREDAAGWRELLADIATKLAKACSTVDPTCTEEVLVTQPQNDILEEEVAPPMDRTKLLRERIKATFGQGLEEDLPLDPNKSPLSTPPEDTEQPMESP